MSVSENLLNSINNAIKNDKMTSLPATYPYSEYSTQMIQFEIVGENIVFELCDEVSPDSKSILCSVTSHPSKDFMCNRFFRLSEYDITPKQVLELFGLDSYTFKITYCDGPKDNYMSTPVHSVPLSQFDVYPPKA
jgi:hypothetical protein